MADAYNVQIFWGWFPAEEGYARAKELAERAIKIDDKLAEAHATLGNILCWGEWKWEEAKKELLLAIELNPNYAIAHQYYAELLDVLIQNEEARRQINIALEHDLYNLLMHLLSAQFYYHEGNINKSLEECFKLQELDPYYFLGYLWSFHNYIRQGNDLKAMETVQKIMLLDTLTAKHSNVVNEVYKNSGISGLINHLIELKHEMNAQDGNIDMWKVYKLFTSANKSSYIDTSLDRTTGSFIFIAELINHLRSSNRFWYLS